MDGDPAVEPELDSLSLTLPLPYRVALVTVIGVWAWGVNLHYLSLAKIVRIYTSTLYSSSNLTRPLANSSSQDVPALIHYPHRASPRTDLPHHRSTYRLAIVLTIPLILSLFLFWALSHRNPTLVIYYDFLPLSYLWFLLLIFVLPLRRFSYSGRRRFLATLRRVSIGGLAQPHDGKFGDILLADVLTSYGKIIADLFVALCMYSRKNGSATARPDRGCGGQYLVPLVIAIPSLIRLRQCMIEYFRTRANPSVSSGWGGQHLANAAKYASAFPVIILSALQRNLSYNHVTIGVTEATLYRLWVFAVAFNSFYSFYWDVAKDWDLTLFSSTRQPHLAHKVPYGLRPRLYFPSPNLYYFVIALDLMLRYFESGIFLLEFLEVGRRWMWIFFRVETEWMRTTHSKGLGGPGPGDILLDDYGSDMEDDG
ncbi:erd1 [Hyphodiscus hymeniophilus]|uniref:Erd1 n=1 Tax=Hyphodiscus hymeniophilus TaxID=353542 RepID=A0A9P6VNX2_9HELO|nr:erd1 [Hyphodiscus hymeniophilus]